MKPVPWSSQFRCYFSVCMWQHLPGMSEGWAKCLTTFQIKISPSLSQASEVVINGGNLTLFETAERHFHNIPEWLLCLHDSHLALSKKAKKKKKKSCHQWQVHNMKVWSIYHRFRWYATLENKTPTETFPKFLSILRVIDRSDRNAPITATSVTLETFSRVFCFPKSRSNENGGNLKTIIATWYLLKIITNVFSDFKFN